MRPQGEPARRVGSLTATATKAPPGGSVLVHMQAPDAGGNRVASFDPSTKRIRIFDTEGLEVSHVDTEALDSPAGLHWLASDEGLVWWDLDRVYVSEVPPNSAPRIAYRVEQPDTEGSPLAIETVRVVPGGLLVVSQSCGDAHVRRLATLVHLDNFSSTDLTPWSGARLHAATALPDGRVVLAVNDPEHLAAAQVQCMLEERGNSKTCWFLLQRSRFHASTFRVLRVHRPGLVEVQSEHPCPERSCRVHGWAMGTDGFVVDMGRQLLRLTSDLDPGPLMSPAGGVWTHWSPTLRDGSRSHSLWLRNGVLLQGNSNGIALRDTNSGKTRSWTGESTVRSARFTGKGDAIVVALDDTIVLVDAATMAVHPLFDRLDVPDTFDPRFGVKFNDASLLEDGTLLFDVVALHRPGGRLGQGKTLWVGRYRAGCRGPRRPESGLSTGAGMSAAELRRLSPWVPSRGEKRAP